MSNVINSSGQAKINLIRVQSGAAITIDPNNVNSLYEMTADTLITLPAQALVKDGGVFHIKNGKEVGSLTVSTVDSTIEGRPTLLLAPGMTLSVIKDNFYNAYRVINNYFSNSTANLQWYWSSTLATSFSVIGTPVIANGVTTLLNTAPFPPTLIFSDGGLLNNLVFSLANVANQQIVTINLHASFLLSAPNSNNQMSLYLAKNDVIIPETRRIITLVDSDTATDISLTCKLVLATGNTIRVWIANDTALNDITLVNGFLSASA